MVVAPNVARAAGLRWKYSRLLALRVPSSSEYGRNAIATGLTLGRSPATGKTCGARHGNALMWQARLHTDMRGCAAHTSRLQPG